MSDISRKILILDDLNDDLLENYRSYPISDIMMIYDLTNTIHEVTRTADTTNTLMMCTSLCVYIILEKCIDQICFKLVYLRSLVCGSFFVKVVFNKKKTLKSNSPIDWDKFRHKFNNMKKHAIQNYYNNIELQLYDTM